MTTSSSTQFCKFVIAGCDMQSDAGSQTYDCDAQVVSSSKIAEHTLSEWEDWLKSIPVDGDDTKLFSLKFASWINNAFKGADNYLVDSSKLCLCEIEVLLLTGRTYQCRGQCQAITDSVHIAGDNMFRGITSSPEALMEMDDSDSASTHDVPCRRGFMPSPTLALQACHLLLDRSVNSVNEALISQIWDSKRRIRPHKTRPATVMEPVASRAVEIPVDGSHIDVHLSKAWWYPLSVHLNSFNDIN
jgi:hypothetical protein